MARLLIKNAGVENQSLELRLGANRIGRSVENDFAFSHPTVSRLHCEVTLTESGATLRDLDSTNGTFVNGQRITHVSLAPGEIIHVGAIEILVESVTMNMAIPTFTDPNLPAPTKFSEDGSMLCPRHGWSRSVYQCTVCRDIMCGACLHRISRAGSGSTLLLCPTCSGAVELIGPDANDASSSAPEADETAKLKLTQKIPAGWY